MSSKFDGTELLETLGADGERWAQGTWGEGDKMCLHGAIRRCQPVPGDAFLVEQVADLDGWGPEWNDDKSTTRSMVRERIADIEITDTDLADTFGPQWEQIVALVRRAAVLTPDESQHLAAAWDADWVAARVAASNAASDACARFAANNAAWAANASTRAAAKVLSVRHLIGQHSYTQDHYDTLAGPWVSVIGKLHPDDVNIAV